MNTQNLRIKAKTIAHSGGHGPMLLAGRGEAVRDAVSSDTSDGG